MHRRSLLALPTVLLACSDAGGRNDGIATAPTGISQGDDGIGATSDASEGTAGSGEAEDGGSAGVKLDVGHVTDGMMSAGDAGDASGCDKVDFLFVIDNSGSMGDNQDSLITSFPGFITSIQQTLEDAQDYHIMVVDTDQQWGGECALLCGAFFGTCPDIPQYPCEGGPPSTCDHTLGAGVNYTMASDAPNVPCEFSTGARYMDSTEPDLHAAFQCAAKVGSDGDGSEKQMSAMVSALADDLAQPGGCNEGFIREDAILVITVITDEEDASSTGLPEGWFANVVASKKGDETAIVMLGLINDTDAAAPLCPAESQDPVKIRTFMDMFPNVIRGSVCEPSYNQFFQDAVDLIDTTCEEFVPPQG
jgi:hypothetical protein